MCEDCGCNQTLGSSEEKKITVNRSVTELNDIIADQISDILKEKDILCINLMGSPGSGKTTFIEGICSHLDPSELVVIQGDLESDLDKKRLLKEGIETYQINTHSGCHLNSTMINKALIDMDLSDKKFLIIENVGNLVCPAGVKIGQHINIVVSSTTEGSDKPKKYPIIFIDADLVLISKYDLANLVDFNEKEYINDIKGINGKIPIMKVTKKNLDSFKKASQFIEHERKHLIGKRHKH